MQLIFSSSFSVSISFLIPEHTGPWRQSVKNGLCSRVSWCISGLEDFQCTQHSKALRVLLKESHLLYLFTHEILLTGNFSVCVEAFQVYLCYSAAMTVHLAKLKPCCSQTVTSCPSASPAPDSRHSARSSYLFRFQVPHLSGLYSTTHSTMPRTHTQKGSPEGVHPLAAASSDLLTFLELQSSSTTWILGGQIMSFWKIASIQTMTRQQMSLNIPQPTIV